MNTRRYLILVISALIGASFATSARADPGAPHSLTSPAAPLSLPGTGFLYQGQLKNGGAPVNGACDIAFRLFDAASGGAQAGEALTMTVAVANGLFTSNVDFGEGMFAGDARWLDLSVRCPAGAGAFAALTPRQPLAPAPYALALPGLRTRAGASAPNVIGGFTGNAISATVSGGVVAGGGSPGAPNLGQDNYAAVGGGSGNTASGEWATVGGGYGNRANGTSGTVGGGMANTANAFGAVPGGNQNVAGPYSFAAGLRAKAIHTGSFVWSDSSGVDFSSSGGDQFLVKAHGRVGITSYGAGIVPTAQLHVQTHDLNVLALQSSNAIGTWASLNNTSAGGAEWSLVSTGFGNGEGAGKLLLYSSAGATVMTVSGGNQKILMSDGANETSGAWTNSSDRNLKANFSPVDGRAVLAQIASLPLSSWNYKSDDPAIRHIGPMAQDFYAAFSVGNDNTHIGTVDTAGVAFAAIQALNAENNDLKARNTALEARMTALEQRAQPAAPSDSVLLGATFAAVMGLTLFVVSRETRRAGLKHNNP